MNAVIYVKYYNSHNQREESIQEQLRVCHKYARKNNYNVIAEYVDRAFEEPSANREQFKKMIEDSSKKEFEAIIVYQLDRFTKNRYKLAIYKYQLRQNNIRILSAKESSDDTFGILMRSILDEMAECYCTELRKINNQISK